MIEPATALDPHPTLGPARPASRTWLGSAVWAFAGSGLLAAIYGRVGLLNLTAGLVGGDQDGYQNVWDNYWVKTALLDQHQLNIFYTNYLYYPTGISLRFHTLNPWNGLLTLPFNLTLGYIPTENLLFVLALALTAWFSFLLIRDLVGNPCAAFAGAAVVAFANPRVIIFYTQGQAEKLSAEWLPLYLFFLFRAVRPRVDPAAPGRLTALQRWGYPALAVGTLLIMSLTDWQYLLYAVLLTFGYFAFMLLTQRARAQRLQVFAVLAGIGGAYALIAGPLLIWPMLQEALVSPWLNVSYQSQDHALDLLDILGPGLGNPGYLTLALALLGLLATWRGGARAWSVFWALVAVGAWALALGPTLTVAGQATGVPLPYTIFQQLPVFNTGRDPGRFTTLSTLAIGVLAAFGLRALLNRLSRRGTWGVSTQRLLAGSVVVGALLLTVGGFLLEAGRAQASPPDWPAFYGQIAADPADYAVLELPLFAEEGRRENHFMLYQVLYNKPRFSGRLARDHGLDNPDNFVKHASLFRHLWLLSHPAAERDLFYPAQDFLQRTDYATQGRAILNYYQVRYIVIYKEALGRSWGADDFAGILAALLGPQAAPVYEDGLLRAYRVPDGPPAPDPLTLDVGTGWYAAQQSAGRVYRWADSSLAAPSELYTMNLAAAPTRATLHFVVYTFQQPRSLVVQLDGAVLTTLALKPEDVEKEVQLDLTLAPGNHRLSFSSPEPPRPTGDPLDHRVLSFGMYGVTLTPQP